MQLVYYFSGFFKLNGIFWGLKHALLYFQGSKKSVLKNTEVNPMIFYKI